jgi:hypothetical protein
MNLLQTSRARAARSEATGLREAQRAEARNGADARVGDTVLAQDGDLGQIERIIRSETSKPIYVVVAARRVVWRRYPVVPWSLVTGVDRSRRRVHVRGRRGTIRRLSETLPLVV